MIQFSDNRERFAFVGIDRGVDRSAVRVPHDHQQRCFEVQNTVIDRSHRGHHLVSDVAHGEDMVVGIAIEKCFMHP